MRHFSLYLHIPYCQAKCPYCDFNSHAATQWPESAYAAALIRELEHYAAEPEWQGEVATIFFGGGTPSLFAPETIAEVIAAAKRLWAAESAVGSRQGALREACSSPADCRRPTAGCETTLEANPGTVTVEKLRGFRAAGINRISFGVQSFNPKHLQTLGRIHGRDEAIAAIEGACAAGFANVNLDLIFAVPGQTRDEWEDDLRTAIALAPDHISAYNLTFEEGTAFHAMRAKRQLQQAPEQTEAAMFNRTQDLLGAAGYAQYEISNYAPSGFECRHNLNYWRGGLYLGVGAGAHSFSRTPAPGRRWSNEKNPNGYLQRVHAHGHARVFEESLAESQARGEFVFLGLRVRDGIDTNEFAERFHADFLDAFPHAAALRRDGLLVSNDARWCLSDRGLMVADSVFATFV